MLELLITLIILLIFGRNILQQISISGKEHLIFSNSVDSEQLEINMDKEEREIKLFELDYSTAVKRYDDNYKSLWTNFSYMAIVAGGILTFGKEQIVIDLLGAIAALPLIFWFWSTFLPLNRYGDLIAGRIAEIEKALNASYFKEPEELSTNYMQFNKEKPRQGLFLYSDFEKRKVDLPDSSVRKFLGWILLRRFRNWCEQKVRVRSAVWFFSFFLHLTFLFLLLSYFEIGPKLSDNPKPKQTDVQLQSIDKTLQNISNSIDGFNKQGQSNKESETTPNTNSPANSIPRLSEEANKTTNDNSKNQ